MRVPSWRPINQNLGGVHDLDPFGGPLTLPQILVVDDEDGLREFLAEALQDDGHVVATTASGEEALKLLAERSFQLMLTDLKMPGMDGITLVRKAKEAQPELLGIGLRTLYDKLKRHGLS